ncbi:hypothetical protein ACE939_13765 [Aquimarina sp. W85]|uniref:hypothetical protein n=1 Tax=Aquimarina rhodophyticola TaxID=3342246 RepID=UPI0036724C01
MSTIDKIYSNSIGMSFYWKEKLETSLPKIQIVFCNTGFLLSFYELKDFATFCHDSMKTAPCASCDKKNKCRNLLLRTPSDKIDLAVNREELQQIERLINETIFRIEKRRWITSPCPN